jgi:hypothetical protein
MYDELRAWFETFQADSYTEAVVAALVDCAETLWQADGMIGEPLGSEAHQALGDLQAAISDRESATEGER